MIEPSKRRQERLAREEQERRVRYEQLRREAMVVRYLEDMAAKNTV